MILDNGAKWTSPQSYHRPSARSPALYLEHPIAAARTAGLLCPSGVGIIRNAQKTYGDQNMLPQRKIGSALLALTIGLALAVTGYCWDKSESKIKFEDCPAAVQKTIIDHAGGVQFSRVEKETKKDGRVIYEAKAKKADGKKIEIKVAADGTLVEFKNEDKD